MGKWETNHQGLMIRTWKSRGLILREGETYKGIYSLYINTDFCNKCSVKFNNENHSQKRCMDHNHSTGYFRKVLCNSCNKGFDLKLRECNKTGHRWISPHIQKRGRKIPYVTFGYNRSGFKRKSSTSLTKLIALSFIHILKKPI